ncbi:hypothetical protein [Flavobacterium geliluteum]|nr:hypothetical protein [Flavobacterium geliluteum]
MMTLRFKTFCNFILVIGIAFLFQSCWVSRCKRPKIVGYIYDSITRKPIENCKVGEGLTDQNGYFQLKELRYSQFTFAGFEAPSLMVNEPVNKEGYQKKAIELFNPFGGGIKKGALHNADTIFLSKSEIIPDFK